MERVRDFGRCGGSTTERSSSDGAMARVIRRWEPLGLEFLEDKEGGLDGEILNELWVEGLGEEEEEEEPWEPWDRDSERKDCRDFVDFVERAETSEELLRDGLRTCLSDLRLDAILDMTLGNDANRSEGEVGDGCWTSDGAEMSEDAMGRAEGGF